MFILGITGRRGAGKDTIADYLAKKYGFKVMVYTDDVLAPILKRQGKEISRENLIRLAMSLRKKHGNDVVTRMLCKKITRDGNYVISGIRFPEEVEYFRKKFGNKFKLLAVICNTKKRYERIKKRGTKNEDKLSFKEFMEIEKKPTEAPVIDRTIKMANYVIDNNNGIKELEKNIKALVKELKLTS
ncbi:MAG: hypothetical protein DRP03_03160 [Candidatus Aenigmatarchaeota archaeon]|nr:MAG: hypothetical protein DRP03_03160 [Candidatus Aenigmarchaeota archaeon]